MYPRFLSEHVVAKRVEELLTEPNHHWLYEPTPKRATPFSDPAECQAMAELVAVGSARTWPGIKATRKDHHGEANKLPLSLHARVWIDQEVAEPRFQAEGIDSSGGTIGDIGKQVPISG
jgi:hypothetical protein